VLHPTEKYDEKWNMLIDFGMMPNFSHISKSITNIVVKSFANISGFSNISICFRLGKCHTQYIMLVKPVVYVKVRASKTTHIADLGCPMHLFSGCSAIQGLGSDGCTRRSSSKNKKMQHHNKSHLHRRAINHALCWPRRTLRGVAEASPPPTSHTKQTLWQLCSSENQLPGCATRGISDWRCHFPLLALRVPEKHRRS
jgi:hypothetical protein